MKVVIAFGALVTIIVTTLAATIPPQSNVGVIKDFPLDNIGVDDYNFGFELSNGQARREFGQLKDIGTRKEAMFVEGSYSYIDPVAKQWYFVTYTADENGYHPKVSHIPI